MEIVWHLEAWLSLEFNASHIWFWEDRIVYRQYLYWYPSTENQKMHKFPTVNIKFHLLFSSPHNTDTPCQHSNTTIEIQGGIYENISCTVNAILSITCPTFHIMCTSICWENCANQNLYNEWINERYSVHVIKRVFFESRLKTVGR